ncbi:MAG: hypothetical protein HQL59_06245 [Magnetococcales bacterium]|nr:hypothetical protein [Magnetococcales bacterium]
MSNPLFDLQQILTGRAAVSGRVVSVSSGLARVATAQGVVEVAADAGLIAGDQVTVRDGRAVRVQSGEDAPVYFV